MSQLQAKYIVQNNKMLKDRITPASLNNIALFNAELTSDPKLMNAFLTDLIDKVAITTVIKRNFNNPLGVLKSGSKPLGRFQENIHVNPVKAEEYDAEATTLLNIRKPDVATEYFQMNRQDKYPITINKAIMQQGFTSWEALSELTDEIVNNIYSGAYIDEWVLMKQLFEDFNKAGDLITVENDFSDVVTGSKSLFKKLKTFSQQLSTPTTTFNAYTQKHTDKPRVTWVEPKNQIILVRQDVLVEMDVEYLAGVFNLSKVELDKQIIAVPDFGYTADGKTSNIQAIICDKAFINVKDDLNELRTFDNPETLNLTYFYHVWQTLGLSRFASHIAIVDPATSEKA